MDLKLQALINGNLLSNMLKQHINSIHKKYKIRHVEMEVLYFFAEFPEYDTPSAAARQLQLTRGHVSQAVDVLLKEGLITGTADEKDRRSMHYTPTGKAAPIIEDLHDCQCRIQDELFAGVSPQDLEAFCRVMNQIEENGKRITEKILETQKKTLE